MKIIMLDVFTEPFGSHDPKIGRVITNRMVLLHNREILAKEIGARQSHRPVVWVTCRAGKGRFKNSGAWSPLGTGTQRTDIVFGRCKARTGSVRPGLYSGSKRTL